MYVPIRNQNWNVENKMAKAKFIQVTVFVKRNNIFIFKYIIQTVLMIYIGENNFTKI